MGSVDFSRYIDLTLDDKSPQEVYEEAVEYGRNSLPELNLRAGTLEDALMQAFSYVGSTTIGAINRLPDGLMEGILKLHGLERLEATFAEIDVLFTVSENGGTVPAGTSVIFNYDDGNSQTQYAFETTQTVTAGSSSTTVAALVRSLTAGVIPAIPIGTDLSIGEPSSTIFLCETTGSLLQGAGDETSDEYLARGTTYLQSLSRVLTTANQVQNFILTTFSGVKRCRVYDLAKAIEFDAGITSNLSGSGTNVTIATNASFSAACEADPVYRVLTPEYYGNIDEAPYGDPNYANFKSGTYQGSFTGNDLNITGNVVSVPASGPADVINLTKLDLFEIQGNPKPGHFVVFVCGEGGKPVSMELKQEIRYALEERIVAGLSFKILDVWTYDLKFVISIKADASYLVADVIEALKTSIEDDISPDNWSEWDSVVRIFDVVVKASKVPGVAYVFQVTGAIPSYPNTDPGNNLLFAESTSGSQLIGYAPTYAGLLPKATVEVTVA